MCTDNTHYLFCFKMSSQKSGTSANLYHFTNSICKFRFSEGYINKAKRNRTMHDALVDWIYNIMPFYSVANIRIINVVLLISVLNLFKSVLHFTFNRPALPNTKFSLQMPDVHLELKKKSYFYLDYSKKTLKISQYLDLFSL